MNETPSRSYLNRLETETRERMRAAPLMAGADMGRLSSGTSEYLRAALEEQIDALAPELNAIVATLHAHPETAFAEHNSARLLVEALSRHGVDAQTGVYGVDTAFRAQWPGAGAGSGPTIGVLAEYDALPEVGHACGHNVIAAAGLGAFLGLVRLWRQHPDAVAGSVVLLGTPAEEGHTGKEVMARHGAFDDIDAAIMVHPYGYDLADQVWLGRRLLALTFTGVPAHASAQPFMGRNALDAAALAYQGIGLFRQQLPPGDRVHAIMTEGGQRPSIIPERAGLKLYARSKYPETLKDLSRRLEDIARGAAMMTGTSVEIIWDEHPASLPVRTNTAL